MKIILKGEHAQRFCEPLIDFMRKNPELFKSDKKEEDKVDLNIKECDKSKGEEVKP
ncbi:hypothetical protein [Bacillus anthracis]|uniref:hypothetical protein n=1 Tax=Bacillus anthracis TaxID=1392 RepID=UPI001651128C|nr:hypothetical protein [Bacillus cereus]